MLPSEPVEEEDADADVEETEGSDEVEPFIAAVTSPEPFAVVPFGRVVSSPSITRSCFVVVVGGGADDVDTTAS